MSIYKIEKEGRDWEERRGEEGKKEKKSTMIIIERVEREKSHNICVYVCVSVKGKKNKKI